MELSEAAHLLDPAPLRLEMGIERLASGVLHVAARTDMHGCTGRMFDWWFRWFHTTQHYVWWHPVDHVASTWEKWTPGRYVGATNVVDERLSGPEVHRIHVHFLELSEVFGAGVAEARLADGSISAAVCASTGIGAEPAQIEALAPDALGFGLLRHAYNEMTFLSRLLPSLYVAESRDRQPPALPWAL